MGKYKRKFGVYAAWNYELEVEDLNKMSEKGWHQRKKPSDHLLPVANADGHC